MATNKGLGLMLGYTCYPQHLGGPAQVSSSAQSSGFSYQAAQQDQDSKAGLELMAIF